ncbi:MAG TPA: CdvA-like protein [Nitrosopumilaceae archaeon]|nr:CdvA-like protein [Nitrosopumilaceae archaeon]
MPHDDIDIIGKNVKDMYGTFMGKVIGTITDIDGSIQTVGVDCGSQGLQQIQFDQLVSQGDVVIFIPKWRLDSQRLIREKQLTLRRLKALIDIVSDNDDMKEDAEIIHEKYKSKLVSLDEAESLIKAKLDARLSELDEQLKSAKMLVFDAKLQHKSDEISAATFETVKTCANQLIEHITHETAEISNVQKRILDLGVEAQNAQAPSQHVLQDSAVSYLDNSEQPQNAQTILPEAPVQTPIISTFDSPSEAETTPSIPEAPIRAEAITPISQPPQQVTPETSKDIPDDNDWLARMEAQ